MKLLTASILVLGAVALTGCGGGVSDLGPGSGGGSGGGGGSQPAAELVNLNNASLGKNQRYCRPRRCF